VAANPIVYVHNGIVELPEDVKADPRFQNGAKLELVPLPDDTESVLKSLRQLAGSWGHSPVDPNAVLETERQEELEDEARWRD
jgi:hypothetical protein